MWVIEIAVADDYDHVITDLYATSRPTLLAGLLKKAPLSARAVAVIRPGVDIIALDTFLRILSG